MDRHKSSTLFLLLSEDKEWLLSNCKVDVPQEDQIVEDVKGSAELWELRNPQVGGVVLSLGRWMGVLLGGKGAWNDSCSQQERTSLLAFWIEGSCNVNG
ncbi:hypothetical protein CEXT_305181 [Caerostris extrusa]|uniref:Uncharacterized protein n=1 Tax=Caerostris extrusa TaxID=172846 RepID=A0AAV4XCL6_CAEEX|nr:hypothetical protein CEXT_305181 [Caerostris extrusa]